MSNLRIELGERIAEIGCNYCGGKHKSAYGFVYNNDEAYGLYFATLHTGHEEPSVGLTLSIGKWWDDDAVDERAWVFFQVWPTEDSFNMKVLDPDLSQHYENKSLGKPLTREAALRSPIRSQFFQVADYVIENDPAVNSYLETGEVDEKKWHAAKDTQAN